MFKLILVLLCGAAIYSSIQSKSIPELAGDVSNALNSTTHDITLRGNVDAELQTRKLAFNWNIPKCGPHAEYLNALVIKNTPFSLEELNKKEERIQNAIAAAKSDACLHLLTSRDIASASYSTWVAEQASHFKDTASCQDLKFKMLNFAFNSKNTEDQKRIDISKGMLDVSKKGCYK